MTKTATRMLRLMDRAVTAWTLPVIGREKGRVLRRLLLKHKPRRGIEVGSLFPGLLRGEAFGHVALLRPGWPSPFPDLVRFAFLRGGM